jgi:PD-(D/E)XK nuclease superfamily
MPAGTFEYAERWVESVPIAIPGRSSTCYFRGRFDNVLNLENGSYGVVDLKTAPRNADHIPLYSRQLHAYAWSLENPAPFKFGLSPIERLGLLVFEPKDFTNGIFSTGTLAGSLGWIEITRDDARFMALLADVVDLLDSATPPSGAIDCAWCRYRGRDYKLKAA